MNSKKLSLIKTALGLFYINGIHAVGINEVLKQSGIAKKTLYHHFASKEELILETLKYRDTVFITWLNNKLEEVPQGKQALIALFYALDDWFNNRCPELNTFNGCFFINACAEYSHPQSLIFLACKQHKENIRAIINAHVQQFEADQEKSEILTNNLCLLKEGAITTAKVQSQPAAALNVIPLVSSLIHLDT